MIKNRRAAGLSSIKRMNSVIKSPAASQNTEKSEFLELYVIGKEKSRLEQECISLDRRKLDIQKRLEEINQQIERLQKTCKQKEKTKTKAVKESTEKVWKKMNVTY